jgi:hypothetical protein
VIPNQTYDVIEIAKLQSAITGILAGFALTIIILLVERQGGRSNTSKKSDQMRQAAIMVFVAMLYTTVLASLLYSINGAEMSNASRAFLLSVPPGFTFAVSVLLLIFGIVLLIGAYRLEQVFNLVCKILWIVILVTLFYFTFTTADVIAVTYRTAPSEIWGQAEIGTSLITSTALLPLMAIIWRYKDRKKPLKIPSPGFRGFILACVLLSTVVAVPVRFLTHAPLDVFVPFWLILLFIITYAFLAGWLILYIPASVPVEEG